MYPFVFFYLSDNLLIHFLFYMLHFLMCPLKQCSTLLNKIVLIDTNVCLIQFYSWRVMSFLR